MTESLEEAFERWKRQHPIAWLDMRIEAWEGRVMIAIGAWPLRHLRRDPVGRALLVLIGVSPVEP